MAEVTMTRLILVRHGETDWNAARRYQGQTDVPLNDTGRRQATALADGLKAQDLSAIYSSDLQRARQTAQAIAAHRGLPIRDDPRLREISFGDWEGLTYAQIQARWPHEMAAWFADPVRVAPRGGETLAQVAGRVQAALDDIVRASADRAVAVIAHGGVLRTLLCTALQLDLRAQWRFGLSNASISELRFYDTDVVLTRLNDTHHLGSDETGTKRHVNVPPHQAVKAEGNPPESRYRQQGREQWED
jgi:alpha-ribazole phosphatase